jgi:hypothetical protein
LGAAFLDLGFPPNKKTTRQRGAGTAGYGGVRATGLCWYKGVRGDFLEFVSAILYFSNTLLGIMNIMLKK